MKQKAAIALLLALTLALPAGCGNSASVPSQAPAAPEGRDAVVIALSTESEPAAGFDPAYGWGAGEHVHEPLIQSTLTVTNADLTVGSDLATGAEVSGDGLSGSG